MHERPSGRPLSLPSIGTLIAQRDLEDCAVIQGWPQTDTVPVPVLHLPSILEPVLSALYFVRRGLKLLPG
jgi:hypothetical protein